MPSHTATLRKKQRQLGRVPRRGAEADLSLPDQELAQAQAQADAKKEHARGTLQTMAIAHVADQIRRHQDLLKNSEALTRKRLIDPILQAYGWKLTDPKHVRTEQGTAQPGRPDYSLIDPDRNVPIAAVEAKPLASAALVKAQGQVDGYLDGPGKTNRISVATDGDKWIFRRPGHQDGEKPLAEVQLSQDKPKDAARTLTRVLRPSSIAGKKMDEELDNAAELVKNAPDPRVNTYVIVDLETTGFSPKSDKIIEVGAVKVVDGKEVDSFQSFVNPGRPIPRQISELTGITDNDVRGAPAFHQVKQQLQDFMKDSPRVAHNAQFDRRFLEANGVDTSGDWYDTMKLSRQVDKDADSHSLENITKRLGIYQPGNHRADQDARLTGQTFKLLMEKAAAMTQDQQRSVIRELSRRNQGNEAALVATAPARSNRPAPASFAREPAGIGPTNSRAKRPIKVK